MKKLQLPQKPFLLFSPFLVLFVIIAIWYHTDGNYGDESRYLFYARYMIDGILPHTDLDFDYLGNGPGYSIILIPFIALHIPLIWIAILNALFYYLSVILLFKTARKFVSFNNAVIISLFWGLYINSYEYIGKILPEIFTSFLMSLLIYQLVNTFQPGKSKKNIYFTGFIIGFIALTKPIFGYVMLCMLLFVLLLWILKRKNKNYHSSVIILVMAFATTTPYLIHTYKVTGRVFYWSSLGGNNFYWATVPNEHEYGSWFPNPGLAVDPATKYTHVADFQERIRITHKDDFDEINKYKGIEHDDAYKRIAIKNIKNHPLKFIQNCISNLGRILFNFPFSYKLQSPNTLVRLPFNGILVVLILVCLAPTVRNWNKIDYAIRFALFFSFIYLGGSILACAETRMFTLIVPVLLIWISFVLQKAVKINIGSWNNE